MAIGLEIPVFGAGAAFAAVELGASRIELNAAGSYPAGGLTPASQDLERLSSLQHDVPVRIMIRPRGPPARGCDFVYSELEFTQMERDVCRFKDLGGLREERGDGFVFGILEEGIDIGTGAVPCCVDVERCMALVQAARPFKAVFHRAFDEIVSCGGHGRSAEREAWDTGLDDLGSCGFDAVLTSGGLGKAIDNTEALSKIVFKAEVLGMEVIFGGGVRQANMGELVQRLELRQNGQSTFAHSACLSARSGDEIDAEEVEGILAYLQ